MCYILVVTINKLIYRYPFCVSSAAEMLAFSYEVATLACDSRICNVICARGSAIAAMTARIDGAVITQRYAIHIGLYGIEEGQFLTVVFRFIFADRSKQ